MTHLRLITDEPEIDPPAPISLSAWRMRDVRPTTPTTDSIAQAEQALKDVEDAFARLTALVDHDPFPFPKRDDDDDDGPWAA